MKKLKKNPKLQLEKFSTIFTQLGLVLVLFVVFISLEHESTVKEKVAINEPSINIVDYHPAIPIIKREVEVQKRKIPNNTKVVILEDVKKVDNDFKEAKEKVIIQPTEDPTIVDSNTNFGEVPEEEIIDPTEDPKPISIRSVQKAPVFKGCEGLSERENRVCFEKKMKKLVQRHFDTELANELGLRSGKKRISTQFVIDESGNVIDIQIRAPHPRLKKEANRIINKIPKFKPGYQNDKPAKVRYTLPISFMVE